MSAEKLPSILPVVFTIGPKADELECLLKYARLLSAHDQHSNHVNTLVQCVIEGDTCPRCFHDHGTDLQRQKPSFLREKKAETDKATVTAARFARMKEADGELYSTLKEAERTVALGQAQGTYLRTLLDSLNGNYTALREHLIINGGLIQDMARLQPQ